MASYAAMTTAGRGRTRGGVLLAAWLVRSGYAGRHAAAAEVLGIHFTTLSQLVNGARIPSLAKGVDIEEKTGVPVRAWLTRLGADSAGRRSPTARGRA